MRYSIITVLLSGCVTVWQSRESLPSLVEKYVAERARLDPLWATGAGIHDHDDQVTRFDDASYEARRALTTRTLAAVRAMDAGSLGPQDRIDRELLLAELTMDDFEYRRRDYRTESPELPLGVIGSVHALLIRDFAPKEKRVAAAVARLRRLGDVCNDIAGKLARPPKMWTEMAIESLQGAIEFLGEIPSLAGESPELAEAGTSGRAALEAYAEFLKSKVLPRSDGSFVYGREAFDFRLKNGLLLPYDADQLAEIGRREFDKTVRMLEGCARSIDPKRDWKAILEELVNEHPKAEELLDLYRRETERARRFMIEKSIVGLPDEKLDVIEAPAFMRSMLPFAAYDSPAPLDRSRLGVFYVSPDPEGHFLSDVPGTIWHEAYPGHHIQLVYAKDVPSLVRRLNGSPVLSEGWGTYCEELAYETGYLDPRQRLMQLDWRLQRAARIILDTGIHMGRISYDEAVAFLVDRVGMWRSQAESSAKGYTQGPTYPSTYMVGMLELVRIRERLRARLGGRFTLKEFHERVLRCGNVPPALIEGELDRTWR